MSNKKAPVQFRIPDVLRETVALRRAYLQTTPFQSKHLPSLKRSQTQWFALKRTESRTNMLCVDPVRRACFFVSESKSESITLLRIPMDADMFGPPVSPDTDITATRFTVFAATRVDDATITIEDTLVWKGRPLERERFSERFALCRQWCPKPKRTLDGISVTLAQWLPLESMTPDGVWELQSDEPGTARLEWSQPPSRQAPRQAPRQALGPDTSRPRSAIATREEGPDQWSLSFPDGTKPSPPIALIKTLAMSAQLRLTTSKTVRVTIVWNSAFNKWEITGKEKDTRK